MVFLFKKRKAGDTCFSFSSLIVHLDSRIIGAVKNDAIMLCDYITLKILSE